MKTISKDRLDLFNEDVEASARQYFGDEVKTSTSQNQFADNLFVIITESK